MEIGEIGQSIIRVKNAEVSSSRVRNGDFMSDYILNNFEYVYSWTVPGRDALTTPNINDLSSRINLFLKFKFRKNLYSHQTKCIELALKKHHTALCTSTASGKSLAFSIPPLSRIINDRSSRTLFIYPVKALANDQVRKLKGLAKDLNLGDIVKKYDGDVKGKDRLEAIKSGRVLLCTPDVLHTTILRKNQEPEYEDFFKNLDYVVLDECHIYSGAFGSNMAYVIRRLRQICKKNAIFPTFILASATIGDPRKHFHALTGLENIEIITEKDDGSPQYKKNFLMVKPCEDKSVNESLVSCIAALIKNNKKFIIFCDSRQEVERLFMFIEKEDSSLVAKIKPYRAGYGSEEREAIERSLFSQELCGVITTSALELGIDLPHLDVCILISIPSSKISLMQRAGRVGRSGQGEVVIIKSNNAFDEYFFSYPEQLENKLLEPLVVNLSNKQLMLNHYACARAEGQNFENPDLDIDIFGDHFMNTAKAVKEYDFPDEILYEHEPHFSVQIRSINDPSYAIIFGNHPDDPPIGTINYSQILREAYPNAIYGHKGKRYRVLKISHYQKKIYVTSRCPQSSTKPVGEIFVKERETSRNSIKNWGLIKAYPSSLAVHHKVTGYTEVRGRSKIKEEYKVPLSRFFVTTGTVIELSHSNLITYNGMIGASVLIESSYPLVYPCAKEDINSFAWSKGSSYGKLYLYDNSAGGLELTNQAVDYLPELIETSIRRIEGCFCYNGTSDLGCVNCVQPTKGYAYYNYQGSKKETLDLLYYLRKELKDFSMDSKANQTNVQTFAKEILGKPVLAPESKVFTGGLEEGVILGSHVDINSHNDRLYSVEVHGQVKKIYGRYLTLIEGEKLLWCLNCDTEDISMRERECPVCGAVLQ